jgi:hypothetical protein
VCKQASNTSLFLIVQREKTSQAFRDALHDQYKSSNAAKKKRRLQDQGMQLQRQSSAPLLNTGNMHEYHGDVVSSNNFESYVVDNTNFLLVEQPERQAKMQKRFSAPMINISYMDKGEGDGNFAGVPSAHNFMLNDYSANVFKFQRNDQAQQGLQAMQQNMGLPTGDFESMPQTMSLPSGEFESRNFVPLSSFKPSKRHSFAGQFGHESMRCIIDEARQTMAAVQQAAPMLPQCEEPDDASIITFPPKNMFGERHHSEPRLTSHSLNQLEGSCAPSTMERINTMPSLSQSSTSQVNNNSFDIFDSRPKTPVNTGPANDDNIELSPIGDGTTCGLFDIFKDFTAEGCDKDSDDLFAPLPF